MNIALPHLGRVLYHTHKHICVYDTILLQLGVIGSQPMLSRFLRHDMYLGIQPIVQSRYDSTQIYPTR